MSQNTFEFEDEDRKIINDASSKDLLLRRTEKLAALNNSNFMSDL